MTLYARNSGAWVTVGPGKIRVKSGSDTLVSPTKISVWVVDRWVDTGYMPATGVPTDLALRAWSVVEPMSVEVQWKAPVSGAAPTSYTVSLFNQLGARLASVEPSSAAPNEGSGSSTSFRATFSNTLTAGLLAPDTNYYVTVTATAANASSSTSDWLKIRTGRPEVTHQQTTYSWGDEQSTHPTFTAETSHYSDMDGSMSVDEGDPSAGALAPFVNSWVSSGRATQAGLWEGLEFGLPNADRLLTKVQVVCEPQHSVYLGLQVDGMWTGDISATSLGIPSGNLLDHAHISTSPSASNVKVFDVEQSDVTFSRIQALSLAVTSFINLYGTSGSAGSTSTSTTRTPAQIPAGYSLWIDATGKSVGLIKGGALLTKAFLQTGTSTAPIKAQPQVPGSAVWAPYGKVSGKSDYRLEDGPGDTVRFRQYYDGSPVVGLNAYLKYRNGTTVLAYMSPGYVGSIKWDLGDWTTSTTITIPGSAAIPAWRARVQDVTVFFKEKVATGTTTVVDAPAIGTISGVSAW